MSLTLIKPYFKARAKAVDLKELLDVQDLFDIENIPSSLVDYGFVVLFSSASGRKLNQNTQEISVPVDVVFYVKGFRYPNEGFDKAVLKAEALIKETEAPTNRLGQCIKNVSLSQINFEQFSIDNDNLIRVRVSFESIIDLSLN